MNLYFVNIDEVAESLPEVTSPKIYSKSGFHNEGLFSQQIFGPIKTATCACSIYWGRSMIGQKCKTCNVDIARSSERRKRFAKIKLPFPVLNPIVRQIIVRAGKTKFKDICDDMIFDTQIHGYYYDEDTDRFVKLAKKFKERESDEEEIFEPPTDCPFFPASLQGLHDLVAYQCDLQKDNPTWKFVIESMDRFFINNVLVPPPEFRPVSRHKDAQMRDEINQFLITILNYSITMRDDNLDTTTISGIAEMAVRHLQKHIDSLYEYVFKKLSKKTGLIRGSILGKRVDFSGRAVITPDPTLTLSECSVPYLMVLELFKMDIANTLLEHRRFKRYDSALKEISECISREDYRLYDIAEEACNGKMVILNRQPTLHRMGLLAFKANVNRGYVIKIHPLVCDAYNADFDGDQMAIYRPLSEETIHECEEKLMVASNLLSPTTGRLILGVSQDIVLGIYLLTSSDENPVEYEGIQTTRGRVLFNKCLPDNFPFVNKTVDKKLLKIILDEITRTNTSEVVLRILDNIKNLGFKYTTLSGASMSLEGLDVESLQRVQQKVFDPNLKWFEQFEALQSPEVLQSVREAFKYWKFIESGSRGSWDQALQIVLARGFVSNFTGDIIKTPIENSLVTGLTPKEFFNSCYGSRKGLLDTALNTGVSGYLTRKLVYATVNLEIDQECDDCGTEDTFAISIPEKGHDIKGIDLAYSLIGRYHLIGSNPDGTPNYELITYDNYSSFVGHVVRVRSPIFCKNPRVCKKCYGATCDFLHSQFVGVIASQALGEVSTQLVLRTFHTSGVAKMAKNSENNQQQDISNDLVKVRKIFHNSGKEIATYDQAILNLFKIYSEYKLVLLVHFEAVVSQMMRVGNKLWRLTEDRESTKYDLVSIEMIPSKESWLLALAFSRPKAFLIDGIEDDSSSSGILERIIMNDF